MADLLIFDKANYMDSWTPEELAKRIKDDPGVEAKYKRRYQKGDIIERRIDGYWSGVKGKKFDNHAFCVINVSDNDMIDSDRPLYDNQIILKKRKYNINIANLTFTNKKAMSTYANLNITTKEELNKHG